MESFQKNNFSVDNNSIFKTRLCTEEDFKSMYDIIYSHNKIAGLKVDRPSFEGFKNKFNNNIITFGFFINGVLNSFLVTRKIPEQSSWYVSMISVKQSSFFNFKESGLSELFDAAIEYWENLEIFSFIFIQSVRQRNFINAERLKISKILKNYHQPAMTIEIIKANTTSQFSLIRELCKNNIYPEDKIVKLLFKKDSLYPLNELKI
jgi:hypothetical protein